MAVVFIPPQIQSLTGGLQKLEIDARSVREVIEQLELQFPGIRDRLLQDDELRPGLSISVADRISSLGLYQKLEADSEVHFIPAIGGG